LVVGYFLPGKPVAMMIFKTFGYISQYPTSIERKALMLCPAAMAQALAFVSDLSE
jgi:hypothetical protein